MVRHSLKNMIEKYPFFFDKRPISNFYKITKVYNENFEEMYNDLFKVYESFHLNKRMYIWKNQEAPYEYEVNFVANYPLLKSVNIYKNNKLIYNEEYKETDEVNSFEYTYHAKYTRNNALKLYAYQCTNPDCNTIYFDYNLPTACTTTLIDDNGEEYTCNYKKYIPVDVYRCNECGEIYFSADEITNCTKNNHNNSLTKINVYKCRNCGQIYFGETAPDECEYCYEDEEQTIHTKFNDESITSSIHSNDFYSLDDNSIDYNEYGDLVYQVTVTDEKDNKLSNVIITLNCGDNSYERKTNEKGIAIIPNIISGEYNIDVTVNGYQDYTNSLTINENFVDKIILTKYTNEIDEGNPFDMILPIIPDDTFVMVVETYEEYELIKGFPENDITYSEYKTLLKDKSFKPSIFDHDYSLDMIGALNDIPRKNYKLITDSNDYLYTEPPFNNRLTEDDYHYMLRMIEYNLRIWAMKEWSYNPEDLSSREFVEKFNPVTLELWKIYGIESTLINREKYILKVFDEQKHPFDESTGLVKCWSPEKWEHKDRFCDGSSSLGEYFFVSSSTVRPIKGQNVDFTFSVLNSIAEPIEEEYYVIPYKLKDGVWTKLYPKPVHANKFRLSYHAISVNEPTVLLFEAHYLNGEKLGSAKVVLNTRTRADYYVDVNKKNKLNYVGDGSKEYPFTSLQEALDNVNNSLNYICLLSDIEITEPLLINQDTIIVGEDRYVNNVRYVPRIFQKGINKINSKTKQYRKDFFKIVGNKNCKLVLSNLRLVSGQVNSFIGINSWLNTNNAVDSFESVIIHGGAVNLNITFNHEEFYPFDYVDCNISLTKRDNDNTPLKNNTVELYYKDKFVAKLITDENGECNYKFNIQEDKIGDYTLHIMNKSSLFFESDVSKIIPSKKEPHYYYPLVTDNELLLDITKYSLNDTFKLYSNKDGLIDTVEIVEDDDGSVIIDEDGNVKYNYKNLSFGKYILYSTEDDNNNSSVKEEWIIESAYPIKNIPSNVRFIKNVVFNDVTGNLTYDEVKLSNNPKMNELDGVVLDIKDINSGTNIEVDTFEVSLDDLQNTNLLYSDAIILQNALTIKDNDEDKTVLNLDIDEGILQSERLGEFWKDME